MSSVVAIVKSIVGQVFVISPEGVRRVLIEGDRLFVGDQIDTGLSGAVTLELADGRTLDLGRDTQWSADAPDSSTDLAAATAQNAPSVAELQQAIAAGADPTTDLEATAAGQTATGTGTGAAGGGHTFVMLDETAAVVDPTIGFPTAGLTVTTAALREEDGTQLNTTTAAAAPVPATVTLGATPTITEAGGTLTYTATVTQAPTTPLTITLSNGAVITIPAGQVTGSVDVPLAPNDTPYIDGHAITVTVTGTTGGDNLAVTVDPTPAVTQVTDTNDVTTVTLTADATVVEGGQITYTATLSNPAQTPVTITLSDNSVITIKAGESTGTVTVNTPANDVYINGSTVSLTIKDATGGNFEELAKSDQPAVTTITDSLDTTTITLSAPSEVSEGGTITYTVTLSQPAGADMTIKLSNGETITIAKDALKGEVTIAAPGDDVFKDEGSLSVSIDLANSSNGNFEKLVIGGGEVSTVVKDTIDEVRVVLTASAGNVAEGQDIVYTVKLVDANNQPVTNNDKPLTVSVQTINGIVDVVIPANGSSNTLTVKAPDNVYTVNPDVTAAITNVTGGAHFENLVPVTTPVVTTVTDVPGTKNDTTLTLTAPSEVNEGGTITYTATLSHEAKTDVVVKLNNGETITIAAGTSSSSVTLPAPTDDVFKDEGTIKVSIDLANTTGGGFENLVVGGTETSTLVKDTIDEVRVVLTASDSNVSEGQDIVYTVKLVDANNQPVTNNDKPLTVSVQTINGIVDVVIPANGSSNTLTVKAPDNVYTVNPDVTAAITTVTGGAHFENLVPVTTPVVTTVTDVPGTKNDTTLTLTAPSEVNEGGTITYTATLSHEAKTDVLVTLNDGTTITIAAGTSSNSVTLPAPTDDVFKDEGSVQLNIDASKTSGGGFENLVINTTPASTFVNDTVDEVRVVLTASDTNVSEGQNIVYTVKLVDANNQPVLNNDKPVTVSVQTINGIVDVVIPANGSSNTLTVKAPDNVYTTNDNVTAAITTVTGGAHFENLVPVTTPVVTTVTDVPGTKNDTTLTLTAPSEVNEGGTITYTATLSHEAKTDVLVTLNDGTTITIAAGTSSNSVTLPAPTDDVFKDEGSVQLSIDASKTSGGGFENLVINTTPASTFVNDTVDEVRVVLTASDTNVSEGQNIVYTVKLVDANNQPVLNNDKPVTVSVQTINGIVDVVIPANGSSNTLTVKAPDNVYTTNDNVTAAITTVTGGAHFENLVPVTTPVVTTVTDVPGTKNDTTLTLTAPSEVNEGGTITYTATLSHEAKTDVLVTLNDGTTITIAAGTSSNSVTLPAPTDDVFKDEGSVQLNIDASKTSGGGFENLVINTTPASTFVNDTVDTVRVVLTASDSNVSEGQNIVYTVKLVDKDGVEVQTDSRPLTVSVQTINGVVDVVIAANSSSNTLTVKAPDNVYTVNPDVTAAITTVTGGAHFENLVPVTTPVTTTVTDVPGTKNDTTLTLTAPSEVNEGGTITYTATLSHEAKTDVLVTLNDGTTITIAAGTSSNSVTLPAPTDDVFKDEGSVQLNIDASKTSGGGFENLVVNTTPASTFVNDTVDTVRVVLTASDSNVSEGQNIVYTVKLVDKDGVEVQTDSRPLTVSVQTINGIVDVVIAANSSSNTLTVKAPDNVYTTNDNVTAAITTVTGGAHFENLVPVTTPVVTTVTDVPGTKNDTTLTLTAPSEVNEGGTITYTATLSHEAKTDVLVTLNDGTTITIAAGTSSNSVTLPAPTDDVFKDEGSVQLNIDASKTSGGGFENLVVNTTPASTFVNDTVDTVRVVLTASDSNVSEGQNIVYTVKLVDKDGVEVQTDSRPVTVSVQTINGVVDVVIAANSSSNTLTVKAPDNVYTTNDNVTAAITTVTGGAHFENLVPVTTPVTTTVTDVPGTKNDTTLTLTAPSEVNEGGTITYTATLSHEAKTDVLVTLNDGTTITIAAGTSSNTVTLPAPTDDVFKDEGSVQLNIDASKTSGGGFENLVINTTPASTFVNDTVDEVRVVLTASDSNVSEGQNIVYTVKLVDKDGVEVQTDSRPLTVSVQTINGIVDVVIAANSSSNTLTVKAPDNVYTVNPDVTAAITTVTGGAHFENLVPVTTPVTTTVTDVPGTKNDTTLTLTAPSEVNEGGTITYTATLSHEAKTDVLVTLNDGTTITIAAGTSSNSVTLPAPTDDVFKDEGSVQLNIDASKTSGGGFENLVVNTTPASTFVNDTVDTVRVVLTASDSNVSEGQNIVYTVKLVDKDGVEVQTDSRPVTVSVQTINGVVDVVIAANSSSNTLTVKAPDNVYTVNPDVTAAITTVTGGAHFENLVPVTTPVTTTVTDVPGTKNDTTLTLTAPSEVNEGGTITYTATLSHEAKTDVLVTLNDGTTITIAAGTSSNTVTLPAPTDDVFKDEGSVQLNIDASKTSGGGFENLVINTTPASTFVNDTVDTVRVVLTASDSNVSEGQNIVYTVKLVDANNQPVLNNDKPVTVSVQTINGIVDVVIPANGSSNTLTVKAPDNVYTTNDNVTAAITTVTGGAHFENLVPVTTPVVTTVTDVPGTKNDTTLTLTAPSEVNEGGTITYTATLSHEAKTDVLVTLNDGTTITIAAGTSSNSVTLPAPTDDVFKDEGSVQLNIDASKTSGGGFENLVVNTTPASTFVNDTVDTVRVVLTASDSNVSEGQNIVYTVKLVDANNQPVLNNDKPVTVSVQTINGIVDVVIPANGSSNTLTVKAPDNVYTTNDNVTAAITTVTGGAHFENLVPVTTPVVTTVTDVPGTKNDTTLTLTAPSEVNEGGTITYTATLSHEAKTDVLVTLNDGTTITIAAGTSSNTVTLPAPTDDVFKDEDSVQLSIDASKTSGGGFENLVINTTPASTFVNDTVDEVRVVLTASDSNVSEGQNIVYTVKLIDKDGVEVQTDSRPLTVSVQTINGVVDVVIAANSSSNTLTVKAPDNVYTVNPDVTAAITTVTGGAHFENLVPVTTPVTTTVTDVPGTKNDTTLTLTAPSEVNEGGTITYTATLSHEAKTDVLVTLNDGTTITIAAGTSSNSVTLPAPTDDVFKDEGSVQLNIDASKTSGGGFENLVINTTPASTFVNDTVDTVRVVLTASDSNVSEGQNIVYTVKLVDKDGVEVQTDSRPLTVSVQTINGIVDVVIAANSSSNTLTVKAPDNVYTTNDNVTAAITTVTGGAHFENLVPVTTPVVTTVTDVPGTKNDTTLTLTAPSEVNEGGTITYTATLSHEAKTDVLVTLNDGTTITIAAGTSSNSVTLPAPTDDVFKDEGSVQLNIDASKTSGGGFENLVINTTPASTFVNDTVDTVRVVLTASDSNVSEGQNIVYTVKLIDKDGVEVQTDSRPVTVSVQTINGIVDVVIAANSSSNTLTVKAPDNVYTTNDNVTAAITTVTGGAHFENLVPVTTPVVTTVTDVPGTKNDTTLTLTAPSEVNEGGTITYTATLSHEAKTDVLVTLNDGTTITIAAGTSSNSVTLPAPTDDVFKDEGSVQLNIDASKTSGGGFENLVINTTPASTFVNDTVDEVRVVLTASDTNVSEGQNIVYTVKLVDANNQPVLNNDKPVTVSVQTINGIVDVVIPANGSSNTLTVKAPDNVYTTNDNVTAAITTVTGGAHFENLVPVTTPVTTTVTDVPGTKNDTTLTLTAPSEVNEGGTITYTATLSHEAKTDVLVTLNDGTTITIAAGTSSNTVTLPAPTDDVFKDEGSVQLNIDASKTSGGGFENLVVNTTPASTFVNDTVDTVRVVLTASDSNVSEGQNIVYTVKLVDANNQPVLNNDKPVTVSVQTINGIVDVVIPANGSSNTLTVKAPDNVYTTNDNVTAAITTVTGGAHFENLVPVTTPVVTTVTDVPGTKNDTTLTLTAPSEVNEGGTITYTATLSHEAKTDVLVTLNDGTTITIAAGTSSNSVTLPAPTDDVFKDEGSVQLNIDASKTSGGGFENLVINTTPASTFVNDTVDTVRVVLTASDSNVSEGQNIVYTVKLVDKDGVEVQTDSRPLTVSVQTINGVVDVVIAANSSSNTLTVKAPDNVYTTNDNVTAAITTVTGGAHFENLVPVTTPVTTTVTDVPGTKNDTTLTLTAPSEVNEGGTITYTATLSHEAKTDVLVTLNDGTTITIAAGTSSNSVTLPAPTDDVFKDEGSVQLNIDASKTSGGGFENLVVNTAPASTFVNDTVDTVRVVLTASDSNVSEGQNIVYTVKLVDKDGAEVQTDSRPVTVSVQTINGIVDVVIAANSSSNTLTVKAPDNVYTTNDNVTAAITTVTGGAHFENLVPVTTPVTTTVTDVPGTKNDTTLTLTAPSEVNEGGTITYTATLSHEAKTDVLVTLNDGTTITIAAGTSSNSVTLPAPTDDVFKDEGSVQLNIDASKTSGGGFENLVINTTPASTFVNDTVDEVRVVLTASDTNVSEGQNIVYTVKLVDKDGVEVQTDSRPLTVSVQTINGVVDVVIAANSSSNTLTVKAPDNVYTVNPDVTAAITTVTGGAHFENLVPVTTPVTTTVTDVPGTKNDTTLTLTAPSEVNEGGTITYTATLSHEAKTDVLVTLNDGTTITIAAGTSSNTVTLPAPTDDVFKDEGSVQLNIDASKTSGGGFENLVINTTPASTFVNDTVDEVRVVLTASDTNVSEGQNIVYTVKLVDANNQPVLNNDKPVTVSVQTINGIVDVVIPANGSSNTLTVKAPDNVYTVNPDVTAAITTVTGGAHFENLVPVTTPVTTTVTDVPGTKNDTTLTLTAPSEVNEGGTITYTATLSHEAKTDVLVTLNDGTTITIAAGTSSNSVTLPAPTDDVFKDEGSVQLNIDASKTSGGGFENLVVNTTPASTFVNDTVDTVRVVLTASDSNVSEGQNIVYTVKLVDKDGVEVQTDSRPVTVSVQTINGVVDVVIAANSSSNTLTVKAPDNVYTTNDNVTAAITTVTGGAHFENLVPVTTPVVTTVTDVPGTKNDTTLTLTAPSEVNEGGTITYTATLSHEAKTDVLVTLNDGTTITIAAGTSSNTVTLPAPTDDVFKDEGSVQLSIDASKTSGGGFENLVVNTTPASTFVNDTVDTVRVVLTASDSNVSEGQNIVYTVKLVDANNQPVLNNDKPVTVSVQTINGIVDVVIPANGSSNTLTVKAPDNVYTTNDNVTAAITTVTGGAHFENLVPVTTPVTTTVTDVPGTKDTTTVTLTAPSEVNEGGTITYTATLSHEAKTDVIVKLNNGETITIAAGTSSNSINLPAPSDDVFKDEGTVKVSIDLANTTGGGFENLVVGGTETSTFVKDTIDEVRVVLTASSSSVSEGQDIVYTVKLVGANNQPVTNNDKPVTVSVQTINGIVDVVIPANGSSNTLTVKAPDNVYTTNDNVTAAITTVTGGAHFENLVPVTTPVTTTVTDVPGTKDTTTVTLTAPSEVNEGGTITYTATLSHEAKTDVIVKLNNGETITIAAGTSSNSINLPAPSDDVFKDEGTVKVSIDLANTTGGGFENLVVGGTETSTFVKDTIDEVRVVLTASSSSVSEGQDIVYTVKLVGANNQPVLNNDKPVTVSVQTINGIVDVVIPANGSSNTLTVKAPDNVYTTNDNVTAAITTVTGGAHFENLVPVTTPVTTTVTDGPGTKDTTTLTLTAPSEVNEGGTITYTATLSHEAKTNVLVTLSDGTTLTIAAGTSSKSVTVPAPTDDVFKDESTVKLNIDATKTSGGGFENLVVDTTPASTFVHDTVDTVRVVLTASSSSVSEGQDIVYTVKLVGANNQPVTNNDKPVTVSVQTINGIVDVVIPANGSSNTLTVKAPDNVYTTNDNVTAAITTVTGGAHFENLVPVTTPVTTTVTDGPGTKDTTTLTLTAPSEVNEGGTITYTATLSHEAKTNVLVTLSDGTTLTIAAGTSSKSVTVPAPTDDVFKDESTVKLNIDATKTSGGGFENLVVDTTPASTFVHDTVDTVRVVLTASSSSVSEGQDIVYTVKLVGANNQPVLNNDKPVTVSVQTINGIVDVVIPANGSSNTLTVKAPDNVYTTNDNVTAAITTVTGGAHFENLVPVTTPVTTTVTDGPGTKDTTTLTLTAPSEVNEGGTITYTATLSHEAKTNVLVTLSDGTTLTIAAGTSSKSVTVPAPTDDVFKDESTVKLNIDATKTSGGGFENLVVDTTPASTFVHDTVDTVRVVLTASSSSVSEGQDIVYTVKLVGANNQPVTNNDKPVTVSVQTINGIVDVVIPANGSSNTLTVKAPDNVYTTNDNVTAAITTVTGGAHFENLVPVTTPVTTTVTDGPGTKDTTTLTLTAPSEVNEGGTITYTATLSHEAKTNVLVTLSDGTTLTIAAGTSSKSVTVPAPTDDVFKDESTVKLNIDATKTSGGGFENLVVDTTPASTFVHDTVDTVRVVLTASSSSVSEGQDIVYTVKLVGANNQPVTNNEKPVTVSVQTINGIVDVVIPANGSSNTLTVKAPDNVYTTNDNVTAAITTVTGGAHFENLVPVTTTVTTTVTDSPGTKDNTTITLTAPSEVNEGGTITYTATLSHEAKTNVLVTLSDGTTFTIAAGTSSNTVTLAAPKDDVFKDADTVKLSIDLTKTSGGGFENLVVGGTDASTFVKDTIDTVRVILTATPSATEGGDIVYTVKLVDANNQLVVNQTNPVTVGISNGTTVTYVSIPVNASSNTLTVKAPNNVYTTNPDVTAAITTVTGGAHFENLVPVTTPVTTTVTDGSGTKDTTVLSITGDASVTEGGTAHYTVSLTNPAATDVNVKLTYTGTAADGSDYTGVYTVKIPAGQSSATFDVKTIDDKITESDETFTIKITPPAATEGGFENLVVSGTNGSVTTKIIDNDAPPVLDLDANNSSGALGADYKVTFNEGPTSVAVSIADTDISITDPDSQQLTGATIVLTNAQAKDALNALTSVDGITATTTANTAAGTITVVLDGSATLAQYMARIKNITFSNSSNDPSDTPRTITVKVTDGGNYSNTATTTVTVNKYNDAPVATGSSIVGQEDIGKVLTWTNFGVTDVDSPDSSLSVKITELPAAGKLQYLAADGTWTSVALNQSFTKAQIDGGQLRFLSGTNESGTDGYGGTGLGNNKADYATFKFQPSDGDKLGTAATVKIDITPIADAPNLAVAGNDVNSIGLLKETWTSIKGLGTNGNGESASSLKNLIDNAGTATTKATVTNIEAGADVSAGAGSKTSGLIYLEAGKVYTFSGYGDDSLVINVGGTDVATATWGNNSGKFTGSISPTASGYYTIEIYHANQSGPGNYDVNLSINGAAAVDLSKGNALLYPSLTDLANAGVTLSDLHGNNGDGYYTGYKLNEGQENGTVHLSKLTTSLVDTDGSESLSLKVSGVPAGAVLTDGAGHTFTATASNGTTSLDGWNLSTLTLKPAAYTSGSFNLTVTATSTEALGGSASTVVTIPVTVYPAVYNEITGTTNNDTLTGTDGNDVIVGDIGGLHVTQGQNYNIAFIVDTSASMDGSMAAAKESLKNMFTALKQSIGATSGTVVIFLEDFSSNVNATVTVNLKDSDALSKLQTVLTNMAASGGTNYEDAFKTASNFFKSAAATSNKDAINQTYFITDGEPTYYQKNESTNPTLYGSVKLDDVLLSTSNYQVGKVYSATIDNTHSLYIAANGELYVYTKSGNSGSYSYKGIVHAQGDGTYELSTLGGDGTARNNNLNEVYGTSDAAFAALKILSPVIEAIGLNSDISKSALAPYDSDGKPLTNIDPSKLADAILGHTEATLPGADNISGGDGNDIIFGDLVSFNGIAGEGYDAIKAFVAQKTGITPADLTGQDVHKYITEHYNDFNVSGAKDANDTLLGGAGDDILFGQGGDDYLDGGKGNDILLGGTGKDTLLGGEGNDLLIGGAGNDILTGGSGADTFMWKAGDYGNDVIKDFNAGEGDRIDLKDLLKGENDSNIDNYLKITTVDGVSTLQVSSEGKLNASGGTANADVTIKLEGNDWSHTTINSLISGADPTIKIDHTS
jgi:hypothetical protein